MKIILGALAPVLVLLTNGCANSQYAPVQDDGPAFEVITFASENDYTVKPRLVHRDEDLFEPRRCAGQNKDPMHLLDPEASCNKFLVHGKGGGNSLFGLGLAIASGNFASYRGDLAVMAANEIITPGSADKNIPDYLKNLTEEQKQVAMRHQAFKTPSDDFNEQNPEATGLWYMAFVAHRTDTPDQSTYVFGYLPEEYAETPEAVLKKLEMEIYQGSKELLEQRGYRLDPTYTANPVIRGSRHGFRGIYGQQCPEFDEAKSSSDPKDWDSYAANSKTTPCLLLLSIGYGGDSRIHEADGYSNFQLAKNDISELIQKVTLPRDNVPAALENYAGKTVWKIAPEFAYDDLKLGLFFPLGMQIDNESFYRELSRSISPGLFLHVAHNPGVPVWTKDPMIIRGVPYLLANGKELAYVPQNLLKLSGN